MESISTVISYQTDAFLQLGVPVQLEQGDVVVEGLAVVVVVDVGGRHPEGLGSRTAKLLGQVVVAHPHVNSITGSHNAEKEQLSNCCQSGEQSNKMWFSLGDTMSSSEDPGLADEGAAAEILVEAVDEGHLPAPLPGGSVLPTNYTTTSVLTLHPAHVFVRHRVHERRSFVRCGEGIRLVRDDLVLGIVPSPVLLLLLPEARWGLPLGRQRLPKAAPLTSQSVLLLLHRGLR